MDQYLRLSVCIIQIQMWVISFLTSWEAGFTVLGTTDGGTPTSEVLCFVMGTLLTSQELRHTTKYGEGGQMWEGPRSFVEINP